MAPVEGGLGLDVDSDFVVSDFKDESDQVVDGGGGAGVGMGEEEFRLDP